MTAEVMGSVPVEKQWRGKVGQQEIVKTMQATEITVNVSPEM